MNHGDPQDFARRLVDKSIEHLIASLETVNRVTAPARFETFTSQLATAWELLIKAKLIVDAGDSHVIYNSKVTHNRGNTISLKECINKAFVDADQDVRSNLLRLTEYRNHSTHLVLPSLPSNVLRLFQSTVFNYKDFIESWHSINLTDRVPFGFTNFVFDIKAVDWRFADSRVKELFQPDAIDFVDLFVDTIEQDAIEFNDSWKYRISLEWKLAYTKNPSEATFFFTGDSEVGGTVLPIDRLVTPSSQYPYKFKKVVELLKPEYPEFNNASLNDINKAHQIKGNRHFHFADPDVGGPDLYSEAFVSWLNDRLMNDPDFLGKARKKRRRQDEVRRRSNQTSPTAKP